MKVVHDLLGIQRGLMNTIHSYTNDQRILDVAHKDPRRARAAGLNIIPTTTGAAKALSLVIPDLAGKFDGFSLRVPTPTVSVVDFTVDVSRPTTVDEVNEAFRRAAAGPMDGILGVSDEPLVSSDFRGDSRSAIIDAASTLVIGGTMVKVIAWYDNEWATAAGSPTWPQRWRPASLGSPRRGAGRLEGESGCGSLLRTPVATVPRGESRNELPRHSSDAGSRSRSSQLTKPVPSTSTTPSSSAAPPTCRTG